MILDGSEALTGCDETPFACFQSARRGPIDADLKQLFSSWLNRGALQLEEITWATRAVVRAVL